MEWIVSPSKVLTWLLAIVMEAAEVNPVLTGTDNKSIRKPSLRMLLAKMTRLVRNDNRTTHSEEVEWWIILMVECVTNLTHL